MISLKDLDAIDLKISRFESIASETRGRISANQERLKKDFKLDNKEDILEYISKQSERLESIDSEIDEKYSLLKKSIDSIDV